MYDILTGKMTTIDKTGKIVSQVMENYVDRKESDIFAAIAKQIIHFKSDITTSMGLPAPSHHLPFCGCVDGSLYSGVSPGKPDKDGNQGLRVHNFPREVLWDLFLSVN